MGEWAKGYYLAGFQIGVNVCSIKNPKGRVIRRGSVFERSLADLQVASLLGVTLVFGQPITDEFDSFDVVRPVERAFNLTRISEDVDRIFVTPLNPQTLEEVVDQPISVPSSPELHRVFDESLPSFISEQGLYVRRNKRAFRNAMVRVGITRNDFPAKPNGFSSEEERQAWYEQYHQVWSQVVANVRIPRSLLVRAEGVEVILNSIYASRLPSD